MVCFSKLMNWGNNYNWNVHQYCSVNHCLFSLNNWLSVFHYVIDFVFNMSFLHFDCKINGYKLEWKLQFIYALPICHIGMHWAAPWVWAMRTFTIAQKTCFKSWFLFTCKISIQWTIVIVIMYLIYYIIIVPWNHI